MTMSSVKEQAKKIIENLPDNAGWDDIMYEFYVKKKITSALEAAEQGKAVSHREAKKRLLSNED